MHPRPPSARHRPDRQIERVIAKRISVISPLAAVAVIIACCGVFFWADWQLPHIGTGPLYIPVIAFATWRLGMPAGVAVTALSLVLNVAAVVHEVGWGGIQPANAVIRASSLVFVMAIVLAARRAYDRQSEAASRDALTRIDNRAAFDARLGALLAAPEDRPAFVLALIDFDDFKIINDTYGHSCGDEVLSSFCARAASLMRTSDCFARIGGDEFVLLAEISGPAVGEPFATRLFDNLSFVTSAMPLKPSISMGALVVPARSQIGKTELMNAADALLYQAKRCGKGAVCIEELNSQDPTVAPVPPVRLAFDAVDAEAAKRLAS